MMTTRLNKCYADTSLDNVHKLVLKVNQIFCSNLFGHMVLVNYQLGKTGKQEKWKKTLDNIRVGLISSLSIAVMCLRLTCKDEYSVICSAMDLSVFVQDIVFKKFQGVWPRKLVMNGQAVCLNKCSTLRC